MEMNSDKMIQTTYLKSMFNECGCMHSNFFVSISWFYVNERKSETIIFRLAFKSLQWMNEAHKNWNFKKEIELRRLRLNTYIY